ncbi:MAG: hypothetical protein QXO15_12150 [Nitrososphaerota archaeon]
METLLRTLKERRICIVVDSQLTHGRGIFRSLPLLLEITRLTNYTLISVYKNIEPLLKLPFYEINYSHVDQSIDLYDKKLDILLIYALQRHEIEQKVVTRCLSYSQPKILVLDTPSFNTFSGKNLSALLAVIPIKYQNIWFSYWKSRPPVDGTWNFAFHKLANEVGYKGRLEYLFDTKYAQHEKFWSWLMHLFQELREPEKWRSLLRLWIESEKIIDVLVNNLKRIRDFYKVRNNGF